MKKMLKTCVILLFTFISLGYAFEDSEEDFASSENISRMFIAPMGRMLPSGMINLAFGGAFASQGGKEYLGLISIGLGGIAEFEISTSHLITNIFSFSEPVGTTALKFKLYQGKPESKITSVVVALRSNRWSNIQGSEGELMGEASPDRLPGISSIDFDVHLTSVFLASGVKLRPGLTLHYGGVVDEIRTRNINYYYSGEYDRYEVPVETPEDLKENVVTAFIGLEHKVNNNTCSIIEIGAKPKIKFEDELKEITLTELWYVMAGVRFFFNDYSNLDAGIRYRTDYSGLADAEIRAGLNIGVDVLKKLANISKRKKSG